MTAARRGLAPLLGVGLVVADVPTALAQATLLPPRPGALQRAVGQPRRPPVNRELRQARGILAGGVALTTICAAGFGVFVYVVADRGGKLYGAAGDRTFAFGGAMLACTLMAVAGIGVGASRVRALRRGGRVAWTGGFGLRF